MIWIFLLYIDTTAMMFETSYIGNLSPATISRCSILNFDPDTVPWMNLYECWAKDAKARWIINSAVYVWKSQLVIYR